MVDLVEKTLGQVGSERQKVQEQLLKRKILKDLVLQGSEAVLRQLQQVLMLVKIENKKTRPGFNKVKPKDWYFVFD